MPQNKIFEKNMRENICYCHRKYTNGLNVSIKKIIKKQFHNITINV